MQLRDAVNLAGVRELSPLEQQGLIQAFEVTHELAWNVMKDYACYQGSVEIAGSRDATREGFKVGLVEAGEVWMEMIKSRNQASHTYNKSVRMKLFKKILTHYCAAFITFEIKMKSLKHE